MSLFGPSENQQTFARLAEHFGHAPSKNTTAFTVRRAGLAIDVIYSEHKGNVTFKLQCCAAIVPDAILRTENATDRFGRRLGFGYEPQTGDTLFDDLVFVACKRGDPAIARLCEAEGLRKGALFILQSGFEKIDFGAQGITIEHHYGRKFNLEPAKLEELLTALEMILAALPTFPPTELHHTKWRPNAIVACVFGGLIAVGVGALIISGLVYTPLDWQPHAFGFMLGMILWFIAIFVTARWLRGKIDAFRAWILGCGLSLIAMPLASISALILFNGMLDTSPAVSHQALVQDKTTSSSGKSGRSYYLHVKSWRPGESTLKIKVSQSLHANIWIGRTVLIVTRKGALDFEWIVSP